MGDKLQKVIEKFYEEIIGLMSGVAKIGDNAIEGLDKIISVAKTTDAFKGLQAAGVALLICMFLIHLGESALKDKNDPDGLFKDLALLGLYSMVIANLAGILTEMENIAGGIVGLVNMATFAETLDAAAFEAYDPANKNWIVLLLDAAVYVVFGNIAILIVKAIAYIAIYTVKIELFIRTMFLPLSVGFIAEDGWRGPGGRYVKRWVGCYLQLGIIAVALRAYVAVMVLTLGENNQGTPAVAIIAGGFAAAGVCMKSSQLSNEIMGT